VGGRRIVALVNDTNAPTHPKLIRTEFGFAVTDGVESFPFDTFNEARDMAKLAATEGMDAVAEALFGPDDYYIEDEDGSEAYARMLERRAEGGTWFGVDRWDDGGY
jgi:hypothetical protein